MSLSARAIAVQGVGFSSRLLAVQGLSPYERVNPLPFMGWDFSQGKSRRKPTNSVRLLREDDEVVTVLSVLLTSGFFDGEI